LILSITTLVRVETQTANTQLSQLEARMNAKLGAMVALGDLQRYTGPDQRVTARSDILLAPGLSGPAGQQRWTGVWSSKANIGDSLDAIDGLNNRQPKWLVSGLDPDAYSLVVGDTADLATVGKSVIDKSASSTDDTVKAPKVEILGDNNAPAGHYAYWVSDEGVKARVNMADPHLVSADPPAEAEYYRTAMAQVADPTAVSNSVGEQLLTSTSSRWKDGAQDPGKIGSLKNIPMFLEDDLPSGTDLDEVNREFFHDFTVHSSGVLADTKDGGLKRDLSTALIALPEDLKDELLFEPLDESPSLGDPGGPKWEQLADYFRTAQSGSFVVNDKVKLRMPTAEGVGIAPVVTRWNFLFFPFAAYLGSPLDEWRQSSYEYSLGVFPLITLWNPYDHDLDLPSIGVECEFAKDAVIRVGDKSSSANTCTLDQMAKYYGGITNRWGLRFVTEATTIPAGRAITFTPLLNSYYDRDDPTNNVLKPGSQGELVNGFFSRPNPGSGGGEFYQDADDRKPWKLKQKPSVTTLSLLRDGKDIGLNQQVVNLYDLSTNSDFDETGVNLFKALTFRGMPSSVMNMNIWTTRLNKAINAGNNVLLTDPPQNFSDVVQGEGASVNAPIQAPRIDYIDLGLWPRSNHICGVSAAMKFPLTKYDEDNELPTHLTFNQNFTSPIFNQSIRSKITYNNSNRYDLYTRGPVSSWSDRTKWRNYLSGTDETYSKVGLSNDFNGNDSAIFYEIPTRPILGVGQLMQANLINVWQISDGLFNNSGNANITTWGTNRQQAYAIPLYAIGNSNNHFEIPLDQTKDKLSGLINGNEAIGVNYDYSYELNAALWDGFFFSGYDGTTSPLPNSKLQLWDEGVGLAGLTDEKTAAANLMSQGAFNINSTSTAAWESILGAMREVAVIGNKGVQDSAQQKHNYSRAIEPWDNSAGIIPSSIDDAITDPTDAQKKDTLISGFRSLTDGQIKELASAIVEEVRARSSAVQLDEGGEPVRHPFLTLADFINRSLRHDDDTYKRRGALQAAIDNTSINGLQAGNTGLWEAPDLKPVPNFGQGDLELEERPLSEGLSAFFMQADVLNKIGSMLHARSDTFTVRSYGSAQNEINGSVDSQAYYEITVQRLPTYLDASLDSWELPGEGVLSLNNYFGRRYKIISERWLNVENI
jgi:hypothetical protein